LNDDEKEEEQEKKMWKLTINDNRFMFRGNEKCSSNFWL